jgi:RimJ/RimL family protein N-acetyltransferase
MIFAETERLYLRALEKTDLPRIAAYLNVWDITRWLSVVPFPYTAQHAEEFYAETSASAAAGDPHALVLCLKTAPDLIGMVGLHPPRGNNRKAGEIEIGYWLGDDYWRRGLMGEAVTAALKIGFARPATQVIGATTAPNNRASQNVLARAGLRNVGEMPRDFKVLRGDDVVLKWEITRAEFAQGGAA